MGAGTEKRRSDRPAENNRPYAAERVSHTVASRETVLTVSAQPALRADYALGNPPIHSKIQERTDVMNEARNKNLFIRVSEKEKNIIVQNAKKCGLSVSEYLRQRALGYMPRAVLPEIFFSFNDKEYQQLQQAVENGTRRIAEIDRLIEKVFEQNAGGILSDERFAKMLQNYEKEQKALTQEVEENRQTLQNAEQRVMDLRLVLRTLREMTDIKELTPTLVNSLIERIEVHNSDKSSGHSHVKVDIYFTAVGMIDIPTEKEILATMEEIRNNPQDFKFVA